jgi:hydrogenase maturation protein HypF
VGRLDHSKRQRLMSELSGLRIKITGIVQGVGFRPFVYGLATDFELNGWVRNTSAGVDIEVDGSPNVLDQFIQALKHQTPPLAQIDSVRVDQIPMSGFSAFEIHHSEPIPGAFIPISPDVSICDDCHREMLDPSDQRYRYPFINCTNCGPRFTIIQDIPYDRPKTTMAPFEMCAYCRAEYEDPLNRRFHAQPVACPECGPQVWLERSNVETLKPSTEAIADTRALLLQGKILAIKGLGGFHLACDATNPEAVAELRRRKLRVDKPFALMLPDLETVARYCHLTAAARELLLSRQRPIVLLDRKPNTNIAPAVAPNQATLGVMLPYTPLHHLLFAGDQRPKTDGDAPSSLPRLPSALVMTSANLAEEPIAYRNAEARTRLAALADAFLMHNRDIHVRCDDSVYRVVSGGLQEKSDPDPKLPQPAPRNYALRRSRGYAPNPIKLSWDGPQILATGPELKNTFCLTKENYAFISHHIGDMENFETLQSFEEGIEHFQNLFRVEPEAIACDLHPNYLATRYAQNRGTETGRPVYAIQHHHAHIAACMADNGFLGDEPVIGVSFDGTGYGDDGNIWGGEFLVADYQGYQRFAHLDYFPLPGGDAAIKKPFRVALALLWQHGLEWDEDIPPVLAACGDEMSMLRSMLTNKINTPLTSSMGRLFDGVAALAGLRGEVNYEAQAAIEFESLADPDETAGYHFDFTANTLNFESGLQAVIGDVRSNTPIATISAKFHNGLAQGVVNVCQAAQAQFNLNTVAVSGGVWQNMTLLTKTIPLLEQAGFKVLIHQQVPTNDGGIALGQATIASKTIQR